MMMVAISLIVIGTVAAIGLISLLCESTAQTERFCAKHIGHDFVSSEVRCTKCGAVKRYVPPP